MIRASFDHAGCAGAGSHESINQQGDQMADRLMLLPSAAPGLCRVLRMPEDLAPAEAFRQVTGRIAALESAAGHGGGPGGGRVPVEDVIEALEERGFELLDLVLGPSLD